MDKVFRIIFKILSNPTSCWHDEEVKNVDVTFLYRDYATSLVLCSTLISVIAGEYEEPIISILMPVLVFFGFLLLQAFLIVKIAPYFKGKASFLSASALSVFSCTPAILESIAELFLPERLVTIVFFIYGAAILFSGIHITLGISKKKVPIFFVVIFATMMIVFAVPMTIYAIFWTSDTGYGM